jgi:hypothetical protein
MVLSQPLSGKSESEVVVEHLDAAETDVSNVLKQLEEYASIVSAVYNKVILIEEKQRMIQTKNQNSRKLMDLLQKFVVSGSTPRYKSAILKRPYHTEDKHLQIFCVFL